VAQNLRVIGITIVARRATTEELFGSEKLLVNLEPGFETDSGIVAFGHFIEWLEHHAIKSVGKEKNQPRNGGSPLF
jgi:hypothetical protein